MNPLIKPRVIGPKKLISMYLGLTNWSTLLLTTLFVCSYVWSF